MGRFAPIYSENQRQAIVKAQVDDGMTARQAIEAARKGKLYDLPAFEFALGTARDYAGRERRRRRGKEPDTRRDAMPLDDRFDELARTGMRILEHDLRRIASKSKPDDRDVARMKAIGSAARELKALTRGLAPNRTGSQERREQEAKRADQAQAETRGGTIVERMLAERKSEGPNRGDPDSTNDNGDQGHSEAQQDQEAAGQQEQGAPSHAEPSLAA